MACPATKLQGGNLLSILSSMPETQNVDPRIYDLVSHLAISHQNAPYLARLELA
ncbi:MAG TPA: hypothetical protein VII66_10575 [Gemmatimonadaceae bacterium]